MEDVGTVALAIEQQKCFGLVPKIGLFNNTAADLIERRLMGV